MKKNGCFIGIFFIGLFAQFLGFGQTKEPNSSTKNVEGVLAVNTLSNSLTISPKVITFPVLTSMAINALPSPTEGMYVFDQTEACLKQYADGRWACVGSRKAVLLLNGPLALNESHSVLIQLSGNLLSPITLPDPTLFTGKEYRIVNHTASTLTCSSYRTNQTGTGNIIPGNTEVLLISDGVNWRQIN